MPEAGTCPRCESAVPSSVVGGLCPGCVMREGLAGIQDRTAFAPDDADDITTFTDQDWRPAPTGGQHFGRYELLDELARGGMGVVYRARQRNPDRVVALKTILTGPLASAEQVSRLYAEAEAAARLDHPGIVPVFEAGEQDGLHFIAMALVEGGSLAHRLADGPLAPEQAAAMIRQIADAIAYAHEQGVIHRDLKPSNILLDSNDQPRVADFGLALQTDRHHDLTATGQLLGTASYMSPEQTTGRSNEIGPGTDVYSLGAILYCMLAGRPPFQAAETLETLRQVREQPPVGPRQLNAAIPRDLETICLKCLEKQPRDRYASTRDLLDDVQRFLDGRPVSARPITIVGRLWRWSKRRPVVAGLASALVITFAIAAVMVSRESLRAMRAEQQAENELFGSLLNQAGLAQDSESAGRRQQAWQALRDAMKHVPASDMNDETAVSIRNTALNVLAIPGDLQHRMRTRFETPCVAVDFDPGLTTYARAVGEDGTVAVHRVDDDKEVARLPGFGRQASGIRFSPDGRYLTVVYESVGARVWDIESQDSVLLIRNLIRQGISFHPDGGLIAVAPASSSPSTPTGNRKTRSIRLYAMPSGKLINDVFLPSVARGILRFHPDGQRIAYEGVDGVVVLRLPETTIAQSSPDPSTNSANNSRNERGVAEQRLSVPDRVIDLTWSPDGRMIAVACFDGCTYLFDAATGRQHATLADHRDSLFRVAFDPTGTLLATSSLDGTTRLWDPVAGRCLCACPGRFVRFSRDGHQLAFGSDYEVSIRDVDRSDMFQTWYCPDGGRRDQRHDAQAPYELSFSAGEGPLLLASIGPSGVRIWDVANRRIAGRLTTRGVTRSAIFHPSGDSLITCGEYGVVRRPLEWRDRTLLIGASETLFAGGMFWSHAALSRDGRTLAVNAGRGPADSRVCVIDLEHSDRKRFLRVLPRGTALALDPDGRWLAVGAKRGAGFEVWDLAKRQRADLSVDNAWNAHGVFSPDGKWLAVDSGAEHRLIETGTWHERWSVPSDANRTTVCFSPDSRCVLVSRDRTSLQVLDVASGDTVASFRPTIAQFGPFACFSPDGSQLAITADGCIAFWDLAQTEIRLQELGLSLGMPVPGRNITRRSPPVSVEVTEF